MRKRELESFIAGYRQEVAEPRLETVGLSALGKRGYDAGRAAALEDLAKRGRLIADHADMGGLYDLPGLSRGRGGEHACPADEVRGILVGKAVSE